MEDGAALVGLAIALVGLGIAYGLDAPVFDGVASIGIGLLLIAAAVLLVRETRSLLTGESASPRLLEQVRAELTSDPNVVAVEEILSMHLGPNEVLMAVTLDFRDDLPSGAIEEAAAALSAGIEQPAPAGDAPLHAAEARPAGRQGGRARPGRGGGGGCRLTLPSPFDAQLVNGPFGDPALYVDLVHAGRAFLLDAGDLAALPPRKLLRVGDVLVSHAHMDHWSGFDLFLRLALGREMTVRVAGPPGMIDRVEHKIRAYTWNLLEGYAAGLELLVTEVGEDGPAARARFALGSGFAREPLPAPTGDALIDEENLRVTAVALDHGIPCLGYAIEEKARVNVWKNRLAEMGLEPGPWLRELKALALGDAPDDTPVAARGTEGERRLPLGLLKERVLTVAEGRKLAYVTDVGWTAGNVERITAAGAGCLAARHRGHLPRPRPRAGRRPPPPHRPAGRHAGAARGGGARPALPLLATPRRGGGGPAGGAGGGPCGRGDGAAAGGV